MTIAKQAIEAHLEEILGHASFRAAPVSSRLLRYLITETQADRVDRLKGYTIAIDVFDRNPDFDAATESVVRVQMGRLRKLLEDVYATGEGAQMPLRISIPKGQYVPRFDRAPGPVTLAAPPRERRDDERGRTAGAWLMAAAGTVMVIALLMLALLRPVEPSVEEPRLFVAAYRPADGEEMSAILSQGLQKELVIQLSRFPGLAVTGFDTVAGRSATLSPRQRKDTDYVLGGTIEREGGRLKVASILTRTATGEVVWSSSSTSEIDEASDLFAVESDIAVYVASTLGQSYGVVQQAAKADIAEGRGVSLRRYRCVLSAYDYMRNKDAERHRQVRACLEDLVRAAPHYASAWGLLSWVYGDEARLGFNRRAGDDPMFRSLRAARTGVEKNPNNAVAQQFLALSHFYSGNSAAAMQTMKTARRLSPNNAEILANAGWMAALSDNGDEAPALVGQAIELNPGHPPWYWGGLALHALRAGDGPGALRYARRYSDAGPVGRLLLAGAFRIAGDPASAERELAVLAPSPGAAARATAETMRLYRFPPDLRQKVLGPWPPAPSGPATDSQASGVRRLHSTANSVTPAYFAASGS